MVAIFIATISIKMGEFPSGQRGQTVNLLLFSFDGPNPSSPTNNTLQAGLARCFLVNISKHGEELGNVYLPEYIIPNSLTITADKFER